MVCGGRTGRRLAKLGGGDCLERKWCFSQFSSEQWLLAEEVEGDRARRHGRHSRQRDLYRHKHARSVAPRQPGIVGNGGTLGGKWCGLVGNGGC